jgi:cell division protein FtsB
MFKVFYYKSDLIKRNEVISCVENELSSITSWDNFKYFCLINKVGDTWQAVVWFWDDDKVHFAQTITHKIPAMAYDFSRCSARDGLFVYHEQSGSLESQWAIKWHEYQIVEQFYPLQSAIHVKNFSHLLESPDVVCYSNNESLSFLQSQNLSELKSEGKSRILSQAKCAAHFDLDNPWSYWRGMFVFVLLVMIYFCFDALLLSFGSAQVEDSIRQLQVSTAPLQKQLQQSRDKEQFLKAFYQAKSRQHVPAKLFSSLTKSLAKDIVVKRFVFERGKVILEGSVSDANGLLNALLSLPDIKSAKLLGDVLPTLDGRQEFKAELTMKEAGLWTK